MVSEQIHLGSANPKEGLYLYKKQFALNTSFRHCVGSKVWNQEVYRRVCAGDGVYEEFGHSYLAEENGSRVRRVKL